MQHVKVSYAKHTGKTPKTTSKVLSKTTSKAPTKTTETSTRIPHEYTPVRRELLRRTQRPLPAFAVDMLKYEGRAWSHHPLNDIQHHAWRGRDANEDAADILAYKCKILIEKFEI